MSATTTVKPVDAARAIDLLRQAIDQDGYGEGYVYPRAGTGMGCRYTINGQASCLVGHALALGGADLQALTDFDRRPNSNARHLPVVFDWVSPDAAEVLAAAQAEQDMGCTWGEALRRAEAVAR